MIATLPAPGRRLPEPGLSFMSANAYILLKKASHLHTLAMRRSFAFRVSMTMLRARR